MAVKIRLSRAGAKKAPYYHIVAADSRAKRDGAYIEELGSYDPKKDPAEVHFNEERLQHWIGVGAQMTETVASLVKRAREGAQASA